VMLVEEGEWRWMKREIDRMRDRQGIGSRR
jgi:hypothetical protein